MNDGTLAFEAMKQFHVKGETACVESLGFFNDRPEEIVNRPKEKFSKGAGSSDLITRYAETQISDQEFSAERCRFRQEWDYELQNKEALYYYRILRDFYEDESILPTMGTSRSL